MIKGNSNDNGFVARLTKIVEANLADEQFGVNELAAKTGLSRPQIHRRLKKATNKSVSQFIREIRLEKSRQLLLDFETLTSSEVAYKVGFGSPSYFIKSFHDYFGYPPGEARNQNLNKKPEEKIQFHSAKTNLFTRRRILIYSLITVIVLIFTYFIFTVFPAGSWGRKTNTDIEKAIVVLPLKNLSSDESAQFFADGISIELRNQLAKIPGLKVITGPTADQLRESTLSSPEIARKVNAKYILSGSALRQENDIHINVTLSDAQQDCIIWPGKYDRENADIFDIIIDISKNVADQLQLNLSPEEIKQIETLQPKNSEAYNNYLMGQYFCLKRGSNYVQKGIGYFEKAIEIDPDFALPYAGLSHAYYVQALNRFIDRDNGFKKACEMADKALDKDSTLSEAYAILGAINSSGYWKWEEARKLFEKGLAIDSNCMLTHLYYCGFLLNVGEPDEALKNANKAIELGPYFTLPYLEKGEVYGYKKKYIESTDAYYKSIELNPENRFAYNEIFFNFLDLNDEASAVQTLNDLFSVRPEYQKYKNEVISVYKTSGINGVLKFYLEFILIMQGDLTQRLLPILYARLGMQNEALDYLEKGCRNGVKDFQESVGRREFENLHSNPRFQALIDTMNLRPYFPKPSK